MTTPVLLAISGPSETPLVEALNGSEHFTVERRCADVTELLAAAAAGRGEICVVQGSHLGINREVVDRLHRSRVDVLALANAEDTMRVAALGCDGVLGSDSAPSEVLAALQELVAQSVRRPPPPPGFEEGAAGGHREGAGLVITVWGTRGAPGRTVLAANIARLLVDAGPTCLIDADTRAPALAPTLGIVEEASGIAAAARLAANGRLDADGLEQSCREFGEVAILTGITRPERWREVPQSALEAVLAECRRVFDFTVLDVCGGWEEPAPGSGFAPDRDGALVAALAAADAVAVVGAADPVGVWRLIELLAVRPRLAGSETVVVTKARPSILGSGTQHAINEALARFAGVSDPVVIPDDQLALDEALLAGAFLADTARNSPVLPQLWELTDRLSGGRLKVTRRAMRFKGR